MWTQCDEKTGFRTCFTKYNKGVFLELKRQRQLNCFISEGLVTARGCATKDAVFHIECENHVMGRHSEKFCYCRQYLCNPAPSQTRRPLALILAALTLHSYPLWRRLTPWPCLLSPVLFFSLISWLCPPPSCVLAKLLPRFWPWINLSPPWVQKAVKHAKGEICILTGAAVNKHIQLQVRKQIQHMQTILYTCYGCRYVVKLHWRCTWNKMIHDYLE